MSSNFSHCFHNRFFSTELSQQNCLNKFSWLIFLNWYFSTDFSQVLLSTDFSQHIFSHLNLSQPIFSQHIFSKLSQYLLNTFSTKCAQTNSSTKESQILSIVSTKFAVFSGHAIGLAEWGTLKKGRKEGINAMDWEGGREEGRNERKEYDWRREKIEMGDSESER